MMKKMKAPPLPSHSVGRYQKKAFNVYQEFFHSLEAWIWLVPLPWLILYREVVSHSGEAMGELCQRNRKSDPTAGFGG